MSEVIIPPYPGITSAVGLLTTDLKYDTIRTEFQVSDEIDLQRLNSDLEAMEEELTDQFLNDGLTESAISFQRSGDLRYVGQGYELRITFADGLLNDDSLQGIFDQFHIQHRAEYGHDFPDSAIEIVNARVTGIGQMPKISQPEDINSGTQESALMKSGGCMFRVDNRLEEFETMFYQREKLPLEHSIAGPAIIIQQDSTTVVPPNNQFVSDTAGNMIISIGENT